MPTYSYRCDYCKYHVEVQQPITSKPLSACPKCDRNNFRREPGGGLGFHFKGTGFYATDYKDK